MAILLYTLCLIPLLVALVWPRVRPVLVYLALGMALVIAVVALNPWLNQRELADSNDPIPTSTITYHVFRDDVVEVAGPVLWRFFSWGVLEGGGASTPFKRHLKNIFHTDESTARHIDLSNPTPFMLLLWLLLLALVSAGIPAKSPSRTSS